MLSLSGSATRWGYWISWTWSCIEILSLQESGFISREERTMGKVYRCISSGDIVKTIIVSYLILFSQQKCKIISGFIFNRKKKTEGFIDLDKIFSKRNQRCSIQFLLHNSLLNFFSYIYKRFCHKHCSRLLSEVCWDQKTSVLVGIKAMI